MSNVNELNEFFGEVISCYEREQALEDGVLVDLNQFIPIPESGYKYPVVCTIAVWRIIESAVNNPKYGNDYEGIVWDILQMSRNCSTKKWPTGCLFQVVITNKTTNSSLILMWPYKRVSYLASFSNYENKDSFDRV